MIKGSVEHLKPWLEQLHVSVRQCAPLSDSFYFLLLLTVSCLPHRFDERMPSFLSHYWIPVLLWVYDATVGLMLKMFFFSPIRVVMVFKVCKCISPSPIDAVYAEACSDATTFTNFRHFKPGVAQYPVCKLSRLMLTCRNPAPEDLCYSIICTGRLQRIPG